MWDCAIGRPVARCDGIHFCPLGVVEEAWSWKGSYSYSYSHSCPFRLACRARQHDSSFVISIPPCCSSSSSSSNGSSSGNDSGSSGRGLRAERAGAVVFVGRAQEQHHMQQQPWSCFASAAVAIVDWKLVLRLILILLSLLSELMLPLK